MSKPLDELYFVWLYEQVGNPKLKNPHRTYWKLCKLLFTKEFVWFVPNDDNRIEDGKALRVEFAETCELDHLDPNWVSMGCSIFELMVALSRRLSFECDGAAGEWFWHLARNLGIHAYNDYILNQDVWLKDHVDQILDQLIWRNYDADGRGGLFPLMDAEQDQRKVEIWYQLNAYILEKSF